MISTRMVMILFIIASLIYILQGCGVYHHGHETPRTVNKTKIKPCTVTQMDHDALVTCPDGSTAFIKAKTKVKKVEDKQIILEPKIIIQDCKKGKGKKK